LEKIKEQGLACVNCENENVVDKPAENSAEFSAEKTETAEKSETEKLETKTYPAGIFINEILPNPKGADETEEYIKIYNSNNFEVDLSGWKLQNTAGTIKTFSILENTKILANNFLIFKRLETKITLHNDGGGIKLFSPDGGLKDSINFGKAPLGQILYRKNNFQVITEKVLPKEEKSVNNRVAEDLRASLTKDIAKTNNPWFLFSTAIIITIISAAVLIFIKFKLIKTNVRT
jgi:hypothetical protein